MDSVEEFSEFAHGAAGRLCRTAFLLCGNWHTAQDLTQMTLAKVFVSWRRINRRDGVDAYAHRTLVNTYLALMRKRSYAEMPVGRIPEQASSADSADLRIVLLQALAGLGPRARAVVILRYWEDHSVDQVAEMLGCSAGSVRTTSSRAKEKLRAALGDALPELGDGANSPHATPSQERDSAHG